MRRLMLGLSTDRRGATAIEYGLIAGLIAVAAIAGMTNLGGGIFTLYNNITNRAVPVL